MPQFNATYRATCVRWQRDARFPAAVTAETTLVHIDPQMAAVACDSDSDSDPPKYIHENTERKSIL
eukprot:10725916-Lingulodinium_polyedra.AAC.1